MESLVQSLEKGVVVFGSNVEVIACRTSREE